MKINLHVLVFNSLENGITAKLKFIDLAHEVIVLDTLATIRYKTKIKMFAKLFKN